MQRRHAAAIALALIVFYPGTEAAAQVAPNGLAGLSANVGHTDIGGPTLSACLINPRACQKQPQPKQSAGPKRTGPSTAASPGQQPRR